MGKPAFFRSLLEWMNGFFPFRLFEGLESFAPVFGFFDVVELFVGFESVEGEANQKMEQLSGGKGGSRRGVHQFFC